ncbi:MAG: hypothetical protein WDO15_22140 [Bacteroidota bacterium]
MMLDCFELEGPELTVPTSELGKFQAVLDRSMKSRRGLIGFIRWQFSKDKVLMTRILLTNSLKANGDGFRLLERMLDRRLNLEHNLTKLRSKNWIKDLPPCKSADDLTEWVQLSTECHACEDAPAYVAWTQVVTRPASIHTERIRPTSFARSASLWQASPFNATSGNNGCYPARFECCGTSKLGQGIRKSYTRRISMRFVISTGCRKACCLTKSRSSIN